MQYLGHWDMVSEYVEGAARLMIEGGTSGVRSGASASGRVVEEVKGAGC